MTCIPICCVTGRIAGDPYACGDCDPCGASHAVPEVVKQLIKERDEWAEKYAECMTERTTMQSTFKRVVKAWDSLRVGDYPRDIIETWLADKMKPAIENARKAVK